MGAVVPPVDTSVCVWQLYSQVSKAQGQDGPLA